VQGFSTIAVDKLVDYVGERVLRPSGYIKSAKMGKK
jgi:hypothetical protein